MRFLLLRLSVLFCGMLQASTAKLTQSLDLPLVVKGKTVGSMNLPVGSEVNVISIRGTNAIISRGDSTYTIAASAVPAPSTSPIPTPTPTPTPTPAEVEPNQGNVAEGNSTNKATPWVLANPTTQTIPGEHSANAIPGYTYTTGAMGSSAPKSLEEKINETLEVPLLSTADISTESPVEIARRLKLKEESKTSYEVAYRRYSDRGEKTVAGCRVFSTSLINTNGKLSEIIFLFANKGNEASFGEVTRYGTINNRCLSTQKYQEEIRKSSEKLEKDLTSIFGSPKSAYLGTGNLTTERGRRWEYKNLSFFLTSPDSNPDYLALRILPSAIFDDPGIYRKSFAKTREELPKRIIRNPNGDVYLELPMINQGGKAYCVVATFSRVLRYYGLRGDMDQLAHAAHSDAVTGTYGGEIQNAVYGVLNDAGAHLANNVSITLGDIKTHIDRGQPLIWGMYVTPSLMVRVNGRRQDRKNATDMVAWRDKIAGGRANTFPLTQRGPSAVGHCAMIIGYNETTQEVAISNSFGEKYAVDWITPEEARAASQDAAFTVNY